MKPGYLLLTFALTFICHESISQTSEVNYDELFSMSLEELRNIQVIGSSNKEMSIRETPGIITVISSEEIQNSGARDLLDVLRMVPGFSFGVDVQGVIGIGIRGNWAHEGKVLLMIDGVEMNEIYYSTLQFGNHYPIHNIDRIEVIRGPGSPKYGGFAAYGVINIITKTNKNGSGLNLSQSVGVMEGGIGRANTMVNYTSGNETSQVSVAGFYGNGIRSDQVYTDIYGNSFDMADNSTIETQHLNVGYKFKHLTTRFLFDNYLLGIRDGFDEILSQEVDNEFQTIAFNASYEARLSEKLSLTPGFKINNQHAYRNKGDFIPVTSSDTAYLVDGLTDNNLLRTTGSLTTKYQMNKNIQLAGGIIYFHENLQELAGGGFNIEGGQTHVNFNNLTVFGEASIASEIANFTFGLRYDDHSFYDAVFVPRLAVTRALENFHLKALFSQSFRAPVVGNIEGALNFGQVIEPETISNLEVEVGTTLTSQSFFAMSFFAISTDQPIIYFFDENTLKEGYLNSQRKGTIGLETELKVKTDWGYWNTTYSYYLASENGVEEYNVPSKELLQVGLPATKITSFAHIRLGNKINFNPSILYFSDRYGYTSVDSNDEPLIENLGSNLLLNANVRFEDLLTNGLSITAGVNDLLGENYEFIQPYNNFHAPLPGPSREYFFKVRYNLSW